MDELTLEMAYKETCEALRVTLADGLQDKNGERANVVFHVIERLSDYGNKFDSWLLHSDGGVKDFLVTYQFGGYLMIVATFNNMQEEWPFGNGAELSDWLNSQERKILATATLLIE